jgi:NAD(P)-dependent dehydrogenase (short-subunit alcohol dehydrogenase family)
MGQATAEQFAAAGAVVVMGDVNPAVHAEFESLAGANPGLRGFAADMDVTSLDSVSTVVDRTVAEFGRIDVLANFAGVIQEAHDVESLPIEEWDRVLGINLRGHFIVAKATAPVFKAQQSGKVVLITSIWAHEGFDLFSAYCASKGGLKLFTQAFAKEMIPYGVTVNAVAPGIINTGLHQKALRDEATARGLSYDEVREKEWGKIPVKRAGEPIDVANGVLWLASAEASYVVGATLDINGAILLH